MIHVDEIYLASADSISACLGGDAAVSSVDMVEYRTKLVSKKQSSSFGESS